MREPRAASRTSTPPSRLVKVARTGDQIEAELVQGLLRAEGVPSLVIRAPGFDNPEFLSAGPRDVLVARSQTSVARDVLLQHDVASPAPLADRGDRPSRIVGGVLLAAALVGLMVCVAVDVLP
jgi:Putative prokaryotic signal transducing protein